MMRPTQLVLFGVFRPRSTPPGFGIPIFGEASDSTDLWVQEVGKSGTVERFVKCDVEPASLLRIPQKRASEPWIQRVGQQPLHAFQMLDGHVEVGWRDTLAQAVKTAVSQETHPFVSFDIAKFLNDPERIRQARAACDRVLELEAKKAQQGRAIARVVRSIASAIVELWAAIKLLAADAIRVPAFAIAQAVARAYATARQIIQRILLPPDRVQFSYVKYSVLLAPLLISAAIAGVYFYSTSTTRSIGSLAILRFSNIGNDPDRQFIATSFPQSLYADFTNLPRLRAVDGTNVSLYEDGAINPVEVGRYLNVKTVLQGKFLPSGDLQVDLVDASNGQQLWGRTYGRFDNLISVQQDIREAIVEKLRLRVTYAERIKLTNRDARNTEAYEHYLKGRYFWNKRSAFTLKSAITEFENAIEKDPNYVLAYVGLADSYLLLEEYTEITSTDSMTRAQAAIDRALGLDPLLAEAYTSRGRAYQNLWQWNKAENEYKRAIELNPNYPTAHQWYSSLLTDTDRLDDALTEIKLAQELDPLSLIITGNVGYIYYFKGDLTSAEKEFEKLANLDRRFPMAYAGLGLVHFRHGNGEKAIAELEDAVDESSRFGHAVSDLGYAYAVAGDRDNALKLLNELEERYRNRQTPGINVAAIYMGLKDRDQAFLWLEKDLQNRNYELTRLVSDPIFAPLRSDTRYSSLLKGMGLQR
jgi:adenylate cyclase